MVFNYKEKKVDLRDLKYYVWLNILLNYFNIKKHLINKINVHLDRKPLCITT